MKKIGLIIQGPLMSIGNEGKKAHIRKVVMGEEGFLHYDCRENISTLIQEFGSLFDTIVISTWDSELKEEDEWKGATVVSMPDPGEVKRKKYTLRSRNKYRQFIGIRRGLLEMEKISSVDYVVRIRTDTYVDLKKLLDSFFDVVEENKAQPDIIAIPLLRPIDFFIHDYYFAANFQAMKKFCDAVLAFDMHEFISCVHRDTLLKHAYVNYKEVLGVSDSEYFPNWPPCGASAPTKKIFSYMFENIFMALDSEIYKTLLWRGSLLSEPHVVKQLGEEGGDTKPKKTFNVTSLISINWELYLNFVKEMNGKKISLKDKVLIICSKYIWKLWNIFRNISHRIRLTKFIYTIFR